IAHSYHVNDNSVELTLHNVSASSKSIYLSKGTFKLDKILQAGAKEKIDLPFSIFTKGTNIFNLKSNNSVLKISITNWDIPNEGEYTSIDLSSKYNDRVSNIFQQKYLSPRPEV